MQPRAHEVGVESRRFASLGAECELYAVDAHPGRLHETEAWIRVMHDRLTRFAESSELSRLNAAAGEWREVSPELEALLRECLRAYMESGGLVHAGILPALRAAGYTRTFALGPTEPIEREAVPPPPLPEMLELGPGRARLRRGTAVDLGGIAKGWLADRAVERVGDNALANLGGDLRARGAGPDGDGWPVGFAGRTLLLEDLGAATSGTERRSWGEGRHHLIDPRTGRPARTDLREVSVLAHTACDAEILAKTALLLGSAAAEDHLGGRSQGWWLR